MLDPFMGMGTTGLVCAEKKRHYIGFELVPEYCERAKRRIAQETAQYSIFDVTQNEIKGDSVKSNEENVEGQFNIFDYI